MLTAGVRERVRVSRNTGRRAPVEYSDAVEQWAREHGGHAKLVWLEHPMNCWCVKLSFRIGDPRCGSDMDGEPVLLHDWWTAEQWAKRKPKFARRHKRLNTIMAGNYAYELDELGVAGIIERLDRGNILSGRGEFKSVQDAGDRQSQKHKDDMDKLRRNQMDDAGHRARDKRRSLYKIPFLPVGVEFDAVGKVRTKETQPE